MENTAPKRRGRPAAKVVIKPDVVETSLEVAADTVAASSRAPMRPVLREEDPRARAAKRAAEIKGHIGDLDEGTDEFLAPTPPDGWTYEWKTKTVMGQENPAYQVQLQRTGWEPVPTSRHPQMMPGDHKYANIERKGMVLMERPKVITDEVKDIERKRARDQIMHKKSQLGEAKEGQFGRDHASVKPKITNSYEPIPVPE